MHCNKVQILTGKVLNEVLLEMVWHMEGIFFDSNKYFNLPYPSLSTPGPCKPNFKSKEIEYDAQELK